MAKAKKKPPASTQASTSLRKNVAGYYSETTAWENDALGRKHVADYLTPFLASIRQPFVVSVDAPYGEGKSYFLQNWRRDLDAAGYLTVYFNAWETDYSEDPLLPFMAAISQQLGEKKKTNPGSIDNTTLKKISDKGPKLVAKTGGVVLRSLIRRYLGDDG